MLKKKLIKALESVKAVSYKLPGNLSDIDMEMNELSNNSISNKKVIEKSKIKINEELNHFFKVSKLTSISLIEEYRIIVEKEKNIAEVLNKMRYKKNDTLEGQVFVPKNQTNFIKNHIEEINQSNRSVNIVLNYDDFNTRRYKPPTFIKTSIFTQPFQDVVNTYGFPRYREVNPGLFTVVTFPFEFGVMFGDIGHGGALLIIGLILVRYTEMLKKTAVKDALVGRYLLLFMGIFATFAGFIYNDFLSIPWNLFGSCYSRNEHNRFDREYDGCVYPIGLDPMIYQSGEEVTFINSFKMKLSVIIGVIHMTFGICLKGINSIYFRNYVDFIFEFLP